MRSYVCRGTTLVKTYYSEGEMVGSVEVTPPQCEHTTATLHCPGGEVTHPYIGMWQKSDCTGARYSHPWVDTLYMPFLQTVRYQGLG